MLYANTEAQVSLFPKPFHSCCQQNSTDSFDVTLKGWTKEDRKSFCTWFSIQAEAEREEEIRQQQAQPAMTMPQYINALMNVNFSNEDSVADFIQSTQRLDCRPRPQPVVLGIENCYKYQLISSWDDLEILS